MRTTIRSQDVQLVVTALRVAAEVFDKDANTAAGPEGNHTNRIAEQFSRQAADARRIADWLED